MNNLPIRETAVVTGEGGLGLDVRPRERGTKDSLEKVTDKKLGYSDLVKIVKRLVIESPF